MRRAPALPDPTRPGRVAAPGGAGVEDLAFHQERVRLEHGIVAHLHTVVHEGGGAERAAIANGDRVRLEDAFLERVALDDGALAERGVVADRNEGLVEEAAAVIEHPATDR